MGSREKKQTNRENASQTGHQTKRSPFVIIGTIIILVIVVIAFVFVPAIESVVVPKQPSMIFGYYDGTPIKYAYGTYFSERLTEMMQSIPQEQLNDFSRVMQMYQQAFQYTVVHTAKMKEMEKAGFSIPNSLVDKEVIKLPVFQENGVFSPTIYRAYPNDRKKLIWDSLKEQLISGTYDQAVEGLRTSSQEIEFVNAMNDATRTFEMASMPISSYPTSEVWTYAESHPDLFKQVHLSVITVSSSEREAKKLLDSIKKGNSTFEETARNNSKDYYSEKGGDMGLKMAYELSFEIPEEEDRAKVMALSNGELSPVIKVPNGWAFFRMDETPRNMDLENPDNLLRVRSYIIGYERGQMENWLIEMANAFIITAGTEGFTDAAAYEGFKTSSFGPLPINYGDNYMFDRITSFGVSELASAPTDVNFWKHAFKTPVNTLSSPIILGDNVVVLYPISETTGNEDNENNSPYFNMYYSYYGNMFTNQTLVIQILDSKKTVDRSIDAYLDLIRFN